MIPGSSSCQKILRSPKVKMQRSSPERIGASKAKGNEIHSPEVTAAQWCGPHRNSSAQWTPLPFSYIINTYLSPDLARIFWGCPSPICDNGTCRRQFCRFWTLVSKIIFLLNEKINLTMASIVDGQLWTSALIRQPEDKEIRGHQQCRHMWGLLADCGCDIV